MLDLKDISSSSFFGGLAAPLLKILKSNMDIISIKSGHILFEEGEEAGGLYIVLSGRLKAVEKDSRKTIGGIGHGETIGELGLLLDEPRSCSVVAIRDSELALLSKKAFHKLVKKNPQIMVDMSKLIVKRYKAQIESPKKPEAIHTITTIPFNGNGDMEQFNSCLYSSLSNYTSTYLLDENGIRTDDKESVFYKKKEDSIHNELNNLEHEYGAVIYATNALSGQWTERAIRQGDIVLVVARPEDLEKHPKKINKLQKLKDYSGVCRWDLVLLHPETTDIPKNTKSWLDTELFERWHHFRGFNDSDFSRLARWYTGNAIGLVLSGGGARGFAHMGAIRALQECNVPIDMVGGVSMGSVVGGEFAYGCDFKEMKKWNTEVCIDQNVLGDFTVPLYSLASGRRLSESLMDHFGKCDIEDLWLPFFCLSCNLTKAKEHMHTRGQSWKAIRASVAIPGIASPVIEDGDLYVDGGIINNMPSDVMANFGLGMVISIDVAASETVKACYPDTDSIHPVKIFKERFFESKEIKIPNIFSILLRAGTIGSEQANVRAIQYADHYIKMPLEDYGMLDWNKMDEIIQIGYEYMKNQIEIQEIGLKHE